MNCEVSEVILVSSMFLPKLFIFKIYCSIKYIKLYAMKNKLTNILLIGRSVNVLYIWYTN